MPASATSCPRSPYLMGQRGSHQDTRIFSHCVSFLLVFVFALGLTLAVAVDAAGQTKSTTAAPGKRKTASRTAPQPPAGPPPVAIVHTTAGDMRCELFLDKTPKAVENFIGLAMGQKDWENPVTGKPEHNHPLYDGVTFHRVIPGFLIQGGDPSGTGNKGPGYDFDDELRPDLLFDRPGRLAMANNGPNTNGSQFFITEEPQPAWNPCFADAGCEKPFAPPYNHVQKGIGFTIFGQCDDAAVAVVKKIARMPCTHGPQCDRGNSTPANPVKITHIEILNAPKPPKPVVKHRRKKTAK